MFNLFKLNIQGFPFNHSQVHTAIKHIEEDMNVVQNITKQIYDKDDFFKYRKSKHSFTNIIELTSEPKVNRFLQLPQGYSA